MTQAKSDDKYKLAPPSMVDRTCLKCDREFKARAKIDHVCPKCKDANRALSGSLEQSMWGR